MFTAGFVRKFIWYAGKVALAVGVLSPVPVLAQVYDRVESGSITDLAGVRVGHHTLSTRLTGCTVVLFEDAAVAGVDVRGSAPGTRETDLLDPINTVQRVNAFVLSGGSAFGLSVADGVIRFLEERGVGFPVGSVRVPIVPQAILFDLFSGGDPTIRPDANCGYQAAVAASAENGGGAEGNVGAGAGATVGKLFGRSRAMKGGLGTASVRLPSGLIVAALVAVNAVGDIVEPSTGVVIAGARNDDGEIIDVRTVLRARGLSLNPEVSNTTIGVVVTNATLTKAQATKVAQMAQDGLARTIYPAHTPYDGDVIFAAATGLFDGETDLLVIGSLAADAVAEAIVRAVRAAEGTALYPAAGDLDR